MAKNGMRVILIVVVVALALGAAAFLYDRQALQATYARVPDDAVSLRPAYASYRGDYPRTDVEFQIDGSTLRGHVYGADNKRGLVVFRHGLFSDHEDYLPFITAMVDKGWRVFAYDALGCGESDGDSVLGMSQSRIDVAEAVEFAREEGLAADGPLVLWGHSWGGYGVAAALASCGEHVDACIAMSGFDSPMKILDYSATSSFGPIGKLQWPFLWLNTYIDFGEGADASASDAIVSSGVPTLVVQGAGDTTVPLDEASILGSLKARADVPADGTVVLKVESEPGRDGHNSYFYSPESQAYLAKCADELQALLDENGDDAGADEVRAYLNGVDARAANSADPDLIDEVDAFIAGACGTS